MLNDCDVYLFTLSTACALRKKNKRGKNRHSIIKTVGEITIPTLKFIPYVFSRVFSIQILIDLNLLVNPNCENDLICFTEKRGDSV